MSNLTRRDLEILRSLSRVQACRSVDLDDVLFTSVRCAQRRMAQLRDSGLIARLPSNTIPAPQGRCAPHYWCLTTRGAEYVAEAFPDEGPDVVACAQRARSLSLRNVEHHHALVELYFRLVGAKGDDVGALRAKAAAVGWCGDRVAALRYQHVAKNRVVRPDAVVWPWQGQNRFFIELDRSTHRHGEVKKAVAAYSRVVAQRVPDALFGDQRQNYLVFITKTAQRRDNLARALRATLHAGLDLVVLAQADAAAWLQQGLFGDDGEELAVPEAESADDTDSTLPSAREQRAVTLLKRLYNDVVKDAAQRKVAAPPSMQAAYDFLTEGANG